MLRMVKWSPSVHNWLRVVACCCILGLPTEAYAADNTEEQFWPELDAYYHLNRSVRLMFLSAVTKGRDVDYFDGKVGGRLDVYVPRLRPVLFRKIVREDDSRMQRMQFRVGYRYNHSIGRTPSTTEQRSFLDGVVRWAVPANILMSDRNRFEFRFANGSYSWRYRNELKLERDFQVQHRSFTAYTASEEFWDSRVNIWNRFRFTAGLVLPFRNIWELKPYYSRQIDTTAQIRNTNVIGITLSVYIPKQ
jgi:hypothetical protein